MAYFELGPLPRPIRAGKAMIYVVVLVTYDYYRFQENLGASMSPSKARNLCRAFKQGKTHLYGGNPEMVVVESMEESDAFNDPETPHLWIQKFDTCKLPL